jgi:hypothetical protein
MFQLIIKKSFPRNRARFTWSIHPEPVQEFFWHLWSAVMQLTDATEPMHVIDATEPIHVIDARDRCN